VPKQQKLGRERVTRAVLTQSKDLLDDCRPEASVHLRCPDVGQIGLRAQLWPIELWFVELGTQLEQAAGERRVHAGQVALAPPAFDRQRHGRAQTPKLGL
jgi:hypothetical protein